MPGTLVLLYHRVAYLERDPHGLAVRPERFTQHCEILRQRYEVVPLRLVGRSSGQVAITFDDGYADNANEALQILKAAGLPATFFITTGWLGQPVEAWWDRLAELVAGPDTAVDAIDVQIGNERLWVDARSEAARRRAHMALFWRLRPLRPGVIESTLRDLETQLGIRSAPRETYRWMTAEELRLLAATDGVEVGAHTRTHPFLSTLDAEEQWREIEGSRRALEELLEIRPDLFSYPYGGPDAVSAITRRLVAQAGYTIACTATGGLAGADSDPYQIPRNVVGDWEPERFERWLDDWLRTGRSAAVPR